MANVVVAKVLTCNTDNMHVHIICHCDAADVRFAAIGTKVNRAR